MTVQFYRHVIGIGLVLTSVACTKAQTAKDLQIVLTDEQKACVIGEAALTAAGQPADTSALAGACGIAEGLDALILQVLAMPIGMRREVLHRIGQGRALP